MTEEKLSNIWCRCARCRHYRPDENVFDSGVCATVPFLNAFGHCKTREDKR
jgi:hypothetical protein